MPGYSPPLGNAVNFTFTGAYTPPLAGAVNFNFNNANTYVLAPDPGVYAITGAVVSLTAARKLNAFDELVTNGTFGTDVSGWTLVPDGGATFVASGGRGVLTQPPGSNGYVYQAIAVTPGQLYRFSITWGPGANAFPAALLGIRAGGVEIGLINYTGPTTTTTTFDFIAPASTIYISLASFNPILTVGSSLLTKVVSFDNVSLPNTGVYSLIGTDVGLYRGRRLTATGGVYAITPTAVTLRVARKLNPDPGVYSLTGADVGLFFGHRLTAAAGVYAITPTTVTLKIARKLSLAPGVYALSGSTVLLERHYIMPLAPGSYTQNRTNVALLFGHRLKAPPGVYELDGTTLRFDYHEVNKISPDPGVYALVGSDVTWIYDRRLTVAPGAYLVQGRSVGLLANRSLSLAAGTYTIVGAALGLTVGGITLGANSGVYLITGSNIRMTVTRQMTLAAGAYTLTGLAVAIRAARTLQGSGSYLLTGTDLQLRAGRRLTLAAATYVYTGTAVGTVRGYNIYNSGGVYAMATTPVSLRAARRLQLDPRAFQINWAQASINYVRLTGGPRALFVDVAPSRYLTVFAQSRALAVPSQDRKISVPPAPSRYIGVYPVDTRVLEVQSIEDLGVGLDTNVYLVTGAGEFLVDGPGELLIV